MSITPFPTQGQYPWYDQLKNWGTDTQTTAENATIAADTAQSRADTAFVNAGTALNAALAPVTPERTTFFDFSSNLFDLATVTAGFVIPVGTGSPTPNSQYHVSDWIPVTEATKYSYAGWPLRITYFNGEKEFINAFETDANETGTITTPALARFVRLSINNARTNVQLNLGESVLPYEVGGAALQTKFVSALDTKAENALSAANSALTPVTPARTTFFEGSTNLILGETMVGLHTLNRTTGALSPNSKWNVTDWIPVTPSTSYVAGAQQPTPAPGHIFAWYTASQQFISSTSAWANSAYISPANAGFMRVAVHELDIATAQVNQADHPLPYEPGYALRIPQRYLPPLVGTVARDILDTNGLQKVFDGPEIEATPTLDTSTTADVYGWYDALQAAHPDYVTKKDLGLSSDGANHLYSYTLSAPAVPTHVTGTNTALPTASPAALLISGIHGYEKAAVYHLWRFAKGLCEEWQASEVLDTIRWNIEIVIVPVGNPFGYDEYAVGRNGRRNANEVDLARNFTADWSAAQPNAGTAPLSEPESIILDALMRELAPRALFGGSFHNFSSSVGHDQMTWQAAVSERGLILGKKLASRMSRKWKKDHAWITDPRTYYGYSDLQAPPGSEGRQMELHGFLGSTFETSRNQLIDGGTGAIHTSRAMTLGYEATVNYIAMGISAGLDGHNG